MTKVSVKIYPAVKKTNKKSGTVPLYLRLINNGQKAEFRLSFDLRAEQFKKWNDHSMRVDEKKSEVNKYLDSLNTDIQRFLILKAVEVPKMSPSQIRDEIFGLNKKEEQTLLGFVEAHYTRKIISSSRIKGGTRKNYKAAIRHLQNFLALNKLTDIKITATDLSLAQRFKDYLILDHAGRKGLAQPTALGIVKKLRTILDEAVLTGIIAFNAFKQIKLSGKSPRKQRLNIQQVKNLYSFDTTSCKNLELYRDQFLFSAFTGLAYTDAMTLDKSCISMYSEESWKLKVERTKTGVLTELFLSSFAKSIIRKYEKHPQCIISSYIFPKRSNKTVNEMLKIIQERANIPVKLTSHIARHTFRQLLSEAGIEDDGVIKRMMGQARKDNIDDVYYSITDSRLKAAAEKFELYLTENLCPHE